MEVTIRQEAGYDLALYGFSLSYKDRAIDPDDWWPFDISDVDDEDTIEELCGRKVQINRTATANAGRGKGHDKFLSQIKVWVDIEAPRYWWSEFDTYCIEIRKQSESTMHTLTKRHVTPEDFEEYDDGMLPCIFQVNMAIDYGDFRRAKKRLPESYLQRRLVTMNYMILRNIIEQRKNHKLPEWATFIKAVYEQAEHKELLPKQEEN
jgi:hypothetical protein